MTDHKAEAEQWITPRDDLGDVIRNRTLTVDQGLALAQVHATLHLAERLDALARVVRGDGR